MSESDEAADEAAEDALQSLMDKAALDLVQHCDSVVILVSHHNGPKSTRALIAYEGNFFACLGQARDWVKVQDAYHLRPKENP